MGEKQRAREKEKDRAETWKIKKEMGPRHERKREEKRETYRTRRKEIG